MLKDIDLSNAFKKSETDRYKYNSKLDINIKYRRGNIILQNLITKEKYIFPDKKAAGQWLIDNNYSKTKNIESARRIKEGRIYKNEIMVISIRYSQCQ